MKYKEDDIFDELMNSQLDYFRTLSKDELLEMTNLLLNDYNINPTDDVKIQLEFISKIMNERE